jgi:hypothetical protein
MPSLEFLMSCAQFGLGYGRCGHCGEEDVFDNSSCFNGSYFCRKTDCTAAGHAKLQHEEELYQAAVEQRRKDQEEWEAADARRRARWAEEDAALLAWQQRVALPLHQKHLCESCDCETRSLRLKGNQLLCSKC